MRRCTLLWEETDVKLKVIGFWGGYPAKNEASSGYLIEHDGFSLLVDCGSGVVSQLQNYMNPNDIDAVILSHYHPDHQADVGILQHALLIQQILGKEKKNVPIYAHNKNKYEFDKLTYRDITKGMVYDENQIVKTGPFTISFMKTKHPELCYAMRIEAGEKVLVYTADTAYMDQLIEFAKDADLLLAESNFYSDMDAAKAGHMTSKEAAHIAAAAGVKTLILTHLPHFGDISKLKEEASEVFAGDIYLAESGLEIHL
jgi:ribonuclease BN (tRNA processing enzyme)